MNSETEDDDGQAIENSGGDRHAPPPPLLKGRDPIMRRTQDNTKQPEPKPERVDRSIKASDIFYVESFSPKRKAQSVRAITQRKPSMIRGACNLAYESFRELLNL